MYRIAILGCENSHANKFLNYVIKESLYPDIEIAGVWSDEPEAVKKLVEGSTRPIPPKDLYEIDLP